jgi:hypothetical protein
VSIAAEGCCQCTAAGCKPDYMPVVVAAVEGISDPA